MGAVLGEEGGNERVGHGLEGAVGDGEQERAGPQPDEGGVGVHAVLRAEGHEGGDDVEQERGGDELAVADLVHDDAADDDAEAEPGETRSTDGTQLGAGEAEVGGPVGEDATPDAEADAGGEDGEEACPKQSLGVVRDGFAAEC